MSRCTACNTTIDFGEEFCQPCKDSIFEYNLDLLEEEADDATNTVPPSGDDR